MRRRSRARVTRAPLGRAVIVASLLAALVVAGCGLAPTDTVAPVVTVGPAESFEEEPPPADASDWIAPSFEPTLAPGACARRLDPPAGRTWFDCVVPAPALQGTLLGVPATLDATVLLPPGYQTSRRYPTIYLLGGFASPVDIYDQALAEGLATAEVPKPAPAIVVVVGGMNAFGGSFYVNSAVTGRWEDAIAKDLVAFVDERYATVRAAASRGLAGDGMGGFGALSVGMHHPETFGAVYAMNATLPDEAGMVTRFADSDIVAEVLAAQDRLAAMPEADARRDVDIVANESANTEDAFAYGAAFAPDPSARSYMRYPFHRSGAAVGRDDAVWRQWLAGIAGWPDKVEKYAAALRGMRGVGLDYDTTDNGDVGMYAAVGPGCHAVAELLRGAGVRVTENAFEGDSLQLLPERLVVGMLPFFSGKLAG